MHQHFLTLLLCRTSEACTAQAHFSPLHDRLYQPQQHVNCATSFTTENMLISSHIESSLISPHPGPLLPLPAPAACPRASAPSAPAHSGASTCSAGEGTTPYSPPNTTRLQVAMAGLRPVRTGCWRSLIPAIQRLCWPRWCCPSHCLLFVVLVHEWRYTQPSDGPYRPPHMLCSARH